MALDDDKLAETLASRAEITDCIYLVSHATDRRRWDLLKHLFHHDGRYSTPIFDGIWTDWAASAREDAEAALESAHHQLGVPFVVFNGDAAMAETYATAHLRVGAGKNYHGFSYPTGGPFVVMSGLLYVDRFESRGGCWRIALRTAVSQWTNIAAVNDGGHSEVPAASRGGFGSTDTATAPLIDLWQRRHAL